MPSGLPAGEGSLEFALAWKRSLGSGYSGVSIVDGFLVTAFADGDHDVVIALDPETGDERWRANLAPSYAGHDGSHDGPIATPAIADGRVFMVGPAGELTAYALASGKSIWSVHFTEDLGSEAPFYGFGGSPVVADDTVVVQMGGEAGSVAGFDAATGKLRWRVIEGEVASQSPIITTLGGRSQVVALGAQTLAGIDPKNGKVLWEFGLEGRPGIMGALTQSPLPLGDDRLLVKFNDDASLIVSVTSETVGDETQWSAVLANETRGLTKSYSPPVAVQTANGSEVYGFSARFLSSLDPAEKELLWRSRDPGDGFLIAIDDQLAVLSKKGSLHLGAASPDGWKESARIELFDDLAWTPPSYAGNSIYARSLGEIARVDLIRGRTRAVADVGAAEIPASLADLVSQLETATESGPVIDSFLAGRELPLIEGDEVTFLWRGGDDVAIAGDMIGMRREETMNRLPGTDLWWWQTELDPHARISYLFFSDYQPKTDPSHDRTVTATVIGPDMNWQRDEPLEMSWFAMPDWPGEPVAAGSRDGSAGRLETIELSIQPAARDDGELPEAVQVPVKVWLPPGYDAGSEAYPVVYVHESKALEAGRWVETLDRVVGKSVAPLIAVFPEFPRMRGVGELFVEQVVGAIDERFRTVRERDARANVGMGWQGLSATALTLDNAQTFGRIGVQSMYLLESLEQELKAAVKNLAERSGGEMPPMDIYLEWGRWDLISPHEEMNMRAAGRLAWEVLTETGWKLTGGEVWDSTDFASWRNRTDVMLAALFPGPDAKVAADRLAEWRTGR